MINFLLFILCGVGITNLVVNATILEYPREFIGRKSFLANKLLSCMMCSGFWVGIFISLIFNINPIVAGSAISFLSHNFSYFKDYIELVIALKAKELEEPDAEERDEYVE